MSSNIKRFILFGDSGAGKSSFVNSFYNYCYGTRNSDDVFHGDQKGIRLAIPCKNWLDRLENNEKSTERDINDQSKSQTMACTLYQLRFEDITIELIDTPGFNDTQGVYKDEATLHQIEQVLQDIPYLSGLIIVANGSIARLGIPFQYFIRSLHQVWPKNLMQNVCTMLTNCDRTSCNFSSNVLQNDIKVNLNATFHLQNSLFRWDRSMHDKRTMRNLKRDFEETIETLEKLVTVFKEFEDIPTDTFRISGIMQSNIGDGIVNSIERMINLIKTNRRQCIVTNGLKGAQATMIANTNWHKQASITAFKWMEVEPPKSNQQLPTTFTSSSNSPHTSSLMDYEDNQHAHRQSTLPYQSRIENSDKTTCLKKDEQLRHFSDTSDGTQSLTLKSNSKHVNKSYDSHYDQLGDTRIYPTYQRQDHKLNVTLVDNEAKSRHEIARRQAQTLKNKEVELSEEQKNLIDNMNSLLVLLKSDVQIVRDINPDIDLLENNQKLLRRLWDEIERDGAEPKFIQFYDQVVQILSKSTKVQSK